MLPAPAHQRRRQECQQQRQQENDGGVNGGKAIHKTLCGRATGLRLFDRVHDARQQRPFRGGCHAQHQLAMVVDAAGVERVAHGLVCRLAFAGDRRLVDAATALRYQPIERYACAGCDAHQRARLHARCWLALHAAIGLQHIGCFGRQIQQAPNGMARFVHGAIFDAFGGNVQRHHHRCFWPLADQHSTGHGHRHEGVNAQA